MDSTSFLTLPQGRRIAYHYHAGKSPTVVFMGGFKSDMTGAKATALEQFCQQNGQGFLRFDYTGHGQSSGRFEEGTIGAWALDARETIEALTQGKLVLMGSSMGAWISLLTALALKERIMGIVGIASAPDFTEHLIWQRLSHEQKRQLEEQGVFHAPSCYGEEPYPITRRLIEEGRNHLLLHRPIDIQAPVRLIHGDNDEDVPWQTSVKLMENLQSTDVRLHLIKGGNHRLSEPGQLSLMCETLKTLIATII